MTQQPPYQAGDIISVTTTDGDRDAVVWTVVLTPAIDPYRRWRLLCQWADDGSSVEETLYCGDDGTGPALRRQDDSRPIPQPRRSASSAG